MAPRRALRPDGDADLVAADFSGFQVPPCSLCGVLLKPDVVFFGESVPPDRVALAMLHLRRADALLVIGSSLMVYSGYRLKLSEPCSEALAFLLAPPRGAPPGDAAAAAALAATAAR